ncbi:hypothetical protein AN958_12563 [Leucoagaricus sp. SymC.cos]|nr:hypothetical protein AN958_12563 [Leucoagaricus sp. SymC.cos]
MPTLALFSRSSNPNPVSTAQDNGGISAMYIVGFAIAGTVFLVLVMWLGAFLYRRRRAKRRRDQVGAAFLSVRGLVKEDEPYLEKSAYSNNTSPGSFSRSNLNSGVVLPSKALIKTSPEQLRAERDFIIAHHRQSNNLPKPFTFALSPPPALNAGNERLSVARNSSALDSRMSRFSVFSAASSFNESITSTTTNGGAGRSVRKVRQTFSPVLPDELFITLGEQLMILQSFDDGWCVVGRESGILMPQPKSLFGGSRSSRSMTPMLFGHGVGTTSGGNVELGMVPAWCFLKPVKGLRAERPIRSSSLGVTVQMDGPGADRNDTISWSNF